MEIVEKFASLLRRRFDGVLATHSARQSGYPFASRVPCCTDSRGYPLLAVSALAEHTRNIRANPRVALSIWDDQPGDVQAAARATVLGEMEQATADAEAGALFRAHFPAAAAYLEQLDFTLYRLRLHSAHYIAGFASVHWLDADALTGVPVWTATEHELALSSVSAAWLRQFAAAGAAMPALAGIDPQGLTLRTAQTLQRFAFAGTLQGPHQIADALEALRA